MWRMCPPSVAGVLQSLTACAPSLRTLFQESGDCIRGVDDGILHGGESDEEEEEEEDELEADSGSDDGGPEDQVCGRGRGSEWVWIWVCGFVGECGCVWCAAWVGEWVWSV